ncbi:Mob1/phocein [Massariosphaeria phaeospora]|uniref:Mob1/phocein n=1 Tax=Massariosphaeria phaeospora TaxID=100035 RepID=A0A7C8I524_9PLEO|nr:Mob1/phocein [Massariosphaeria phaeospora]
MFVSSSSTVYPSFPAKPKPLQSIFTAVQSQSCMSLGMDILEGRDPLQRIGEAFWTPQGTATSTPLVPDTAATRLRTVQHPASPPPTPRSSPMLQSGGGSPTRRIPNYSYKLLPGGNTSPSIDSAKGSGWASGTLGFNGTISSPASRAQMQSQNHSYFTGTGLLSALFSNPRTRGPFKPQKSNRGTSSWQLKQYAEATLGSGSLRKAVKLPEGEDKDEWLAVNVVDFYNQINLLYGAITEFCSPQSCPEMKATDEFEYLWQDSENYKKPTKMSAPEYIEHLMAWVQSNVDNEQMFPSRIGVPFPKTFPALLRNMFKRLYRVYAHIYCHHYPVVIELGLEPHLNTSFKHYVLFIDEHGLANGSKDFWGPLGDLVESMLRSD